MHTGKTIQIIVVLLFFLLIEKSSAQNRPIGTIKVDNGDFIDQTEIDVGSWLSYYTWLLNYKGYKVAQKALPDSSTIDSEVWRYIRKRTSKYNNKMALYSGQPIGFFEKKCDVVKNLGARIPSTKLCPILYLPITGITYEQVTEFCEWRTAVQGQGDFVFRLPTPEEWTKIALDGLTTSEKENGFRDSVNDKGCPLFNFSSTNCSDFPYQGLLNGIGLYSPDKLGLFDIWGNVSEMTTEKGLAKGGNFTLHANQSHYDSIQRYTKPEAWLGFRCIAVKKERVNDKSLMSKDTTVYPNEEALELKGDSVSEIIWNDNSGTFRDLRDGRNYSVVQIGDQVWMAQNLAYRPHRGKFWIYNNDLNYLSQFGFLYNWETAKSVCPTGWHLPDKEEFELLLKYLSANGHDPHSEIIVTGKSGFSAIFGGLYLGNTFTPLDGGTAFWASTEKDSRNAYGLSIGSDIKSVNLQNSINKRSGLPVRCVKNH